MPNISIIQILEKLGERLDLVKAEELLALALESLELPVQESYTPAQVVAIGAAIAEAQRSLLAGSEIPQARELEQVVAPFLDSIKKDAPHKR